MMPRLLKGILLGFSIAVLALVFSSFQFSLDSEENLGLGLLFRLRGRVSAPADVVVVSIDKESSEHLNLPNNPDKWPRTLHASLVEKLSREGAGLIVFDVHFIEARSDEEDLSLAEAIRKAGNVVLAEPLVAREIASADTSNFYDHTHSVVRAVKPIAPLTEAAVATAPFPLPRIPFKVNQYWTFQSGAGNAPTMPVVAFQLFTLPVYEEFIRLLQKAVPDEAAKLPRDAGAVVKARSIRSLVRSTREIFESHPSAAESMLNELQNLDALTADEHRHRMLRSLILMYGGVGRPYINFYGPPRSITTIPYYQALQIGANPEHGQTTDLRGKVVFVGLSEVLMAERKDSFYTVFSQANGLFIGGVEIAATAFLNLMHESPVRPIRTGWYILILFGWSILLGVICRTAPVLVAASSVIGLSVIYLFLADHQFTDGNTWYPVVLPLFFESPLIFFGAVMWNYFETNKERKNMRKAFGYYLPNEIVDQLAKNIANIKRSGQLVYGTCLFTDAEHYTTLSETMAPQELSDYMGKYFEALFAPVKQHGGFVVDLKGDSILALWKATQPQVSLRERACLAALDISEAVRRFNRSFETHPLPTRIGLHSGELMLGTVGAGDHYEYRPTGDTVNTASRLEGLNKHLGTQILVSEETVRQLDGFLTRKLGRFRLKGKAEPIAVRELCGRMEEANEKQKSACAVFDEAMDAFIRRSWDEAIEKFHRCTEAFAGDGPSLSYVKLCEQYRQNPPEEPWDGTIEMHKK